jgi:hypothetical protein
LLAWTVRWPKGRTVAQKTCPLGEKGIKVVGGLNNLARLSRNDATGRLCLFGGRSHRHGKIVMLIIVLAFFFAARDHFLLLLRLSSLLLVIAQPLLAIIATNLFLVLTLVASRSRIF